MILATAYEEWTDAALEDRHYKNPVISCQNYKAISVVTLLIMRHMTPPTDQDTLPFVGSDSKTRTKRQDLGSLGSVDAEEARIEEDKAAEVDGETRYARAVNHMDGDPSSKDFLVGTRMAYMKGFTYRSVRAFVPMVRGRAGKQEAVRMGSTFRCVSGVRKFCAKNPAAGKNNLKSRSFDGAVFEDDLGGMVLLTIFEMQAYLYYPFCLYTEGVVGHTFDKYCMVHFMSEFMRENDYTSMVESVKKAEKTLGEYAWMCPRVKMLNVATSRVTMGNKIDIIEKSRGRSISLTREEQLGECNSTPASQSEAA